MVDAVEHMREHLRQARAQYSVIEIARAAEMHPTHVSRVLSGQMPRGSTLGKLKLGLARLRQRQDGALNNVALYRAVLALAAQELRLDPAQVQNFDPARKQTQNAEWLAAANARRVAQYVLSVGLGLPQAQVARLTGVTKQAVSLAIREVEELRDGPHGFDDLIARLETMVCGEDVA